MAEVYFPQYILYSLFVCIFFRMVMFYMYYLDRHNLSYSLSFNIGNAFSVFTVLVNFNVQFIVISRLFVGFVLFKFSSAAVCIWTRASNWLWLSVFERLLNHEDYKGASSVCLH